MRRTSPPIARRCRVPGRTARRPDRSPRTSCTSLLLLLMDWLGDTHNTNHTHRTPQYGAQDLLLRPAMGGCEDDNCVDRDRCARGVLLRRVADPVSAS